MPDTIGMMAQATNNALRFGWYSGVNWLASREAKRHGSPPRYMPERPVPSRDELMADLRLLFRRDAEAVRDGVFPPMDDDTGGLAAHLGRLRAMFADLPGTTARRTSREAGSAATNPEAAELPAYFTQDFHYQTGGYLSQDSARLYDVQVETLFYGSAAAMRRAALRPIAAYLRGRDQRAMSLLDAACGTGRFLRQVRLAYPAMQLNGVDLSKPYLREAEDHLSGLRPAHLVFSNAEALPFADASQDIVSCIFLFHELPPDVRRRVTSEIARVLKPGGLFVFVDSLQFGDKPGWDGLLEAFPVRFHEPYYRSYVIDDLAKMFSEAGLTHGASDLAFMSKIEVWTKPA